MSDKSVFCSQCGAALTPGNAFCDQCGHRVATAAVAIPIPSPPTPPATSPPPGVSPLILLGVFVIAVVVVGAGAAMFRDRFRIPSVVEAPPATNGPASIPTSIPAPPDKPAILADPVGAFDDKGTAPVEVAYVHFLDEAHRRTKGTIRVGSPISTLTRIEVAVTADGKPESLVVIEKANNGRQATVLVGPKDAGAVRSYSLSLGPNGWTIDSFQDLDG